MVDCFDDSSLAWSHTNALVLPGDGPFWALNQFAFAAIVAVVSGRRGGAISIGPMRPSAVALDATHRDSYCNRYITNLLYIQYVESKTAGGSCRDVLAGNAASAGDGILQEKATDASSESEFGKRTGIAVGAGIGPSTADKILQMRKSYGAFKSVDDLLAIKGIGPKKLDKMKKYLTVGKMPQSKKPATAAQAASAQGKAPPGKGAKAAPAQKPVPPTVSESKEP